MPTYERFEDLPVWQEATRLYEAVDALLAVRPPGIIRSFADQLERAAPPGRRAPCFACWSASRASLI